MSLVVERQRPARVGETPNSALRAVHEAIPDEVVPRPVSLIVDAQRAALRPLGALVVADGEPFDSEVNDLARLRRSTQVPEGLHDRPEEADELRARHHRPMLSHGLERVPPHGSREDDRADEPRQSEAEFQSDAALGDERIGFEFERLAVRGRDARRRGWWCRCRAAGRCSPSRGRASGCSASQSSRSALRLAEGVEARTASVLTCAVSRSCSGWPISSHRTWAASTLGLQGDGLALGGSALRPSGSPCWRPGASACRRLLVTIRRPRAARPSGVAACSPPPRSRSSSSRRVQETWPARRVISYSVIGWDDGARWRRARLGGGHRAGPRRSRAGPTGGICRGGSGVPVSMAHRWRRSRRPVAGRGRRRPGPGRRRRRGRGLGGGLGTWPRSPARGRRRRRTGGRCPPWRPEPDGPWWRSRSRRDPRRGRRRRSDGGGRRPCGPPATARRCGPR